MTHAAVDLTDYTLDAGAQTCTFPLGDGAAEGDVIRVRYPYRRGGGVTGGFLPIDHMEQYGYSGIALDPSYDAAVSDDSDATYLLSNDTNDNPSYFAFFDAAALADAEEFTAQIRVIYEPPPGGPNGSEQVQYVISDTGNVLTQIWGFLALVPGVNDLTVTVDQAFVDLWKNAPYPSNNGEWQITPSGYTTYAEVRDALGPLPSTIGFFSVPAGSTTKLTRMSIRYSIAPEGL